MTLDIKLVDYYNVTVYGDAAEGFKLLDVFANVGISLLAFKAVPVGPKETQFTLFPDVSSKMIEGAKNAGLEIEGPYSAIIVKSDTDELGECAMVHEKLAKAGVHVSESSGIADIKDSYGIVLYVDDSEKALKALA